MFQTPRLRSAFPETPRHEPGSIKQFGSGSSLASNSTPLRSRKSIIRPQSAVNVTSTSSSNGGNGSPPLIPESLLPGPQQRVIALGFYVALLAWKGLDYTSLDTYNSVESSWLFMKWSLIDAIYFMAITSVQIPWLEWSFPTSFGLIALHIFADFWMMFNMSLPWGRLLAGVWGLIYSKELSLSDTRVNPNEVIHGSSIILGKQIINLLPEGSAILNPQSLSYCLDSTHTLVNIPIQINQTSPDLIELLRYDLMTDEVETITIGVKQARKMKKEADRGHDKSDTKTPRTLQYPVTKTGLYQLQRVMDKSKLEVRRRSNDVAVVPCPRASVSANHLDRCTGDLSGISMHVTGVPPLKVKYNKRINHQQSSSIVQTIQSTGGQDDESAGIVLDPKRPHMGWTQSRSLSVDINEFLGQNGTWMYTLEEVEDGLKNKVKFDLPNERKVQAERHSQAVTVHKRPFLKLNGCDSEHYLRVAREESVKMPLEVGPRAQLPASDWPLTMKYTFTPQTEDKYPTLEELSYELKKEGDGPPIGRAGRYDIVSLESKFCAGEINEPSSCLLYNPPRPSLAYNTREVFDRCDRRPIGIDVDFSFTGSPTFKVQYEVVREGAGSTRKTQEFNTMQGRLEIREQSAGAYKYRILSIEDSVYGPISVASDENTFEQNIRPPANAFFKVATAPVKACLNSPVSMQVQLLGEGPWQLNYELVHAGKRKKFSAESDSENLVIEVPPQSAGGKYTLLLTDVQDSSRCETKLKEERYIEVRPEQPRAAFGDINGKRDVEALQDKNIQIPVKLKGVAPWKVVIENDQRGTMEHRFDNANSFIKGNSAGTYRIISVQDSCPGVVDAKADRFDISWIKRPELGILDESAQEVAGRRSYRKQAVCQGDEDSLGLSLSGHSPYHLKYSVKAEPLKGQVALTNKPLSVASHKATINMDTSKAGQYTYTFNELGDNRYAHDSKHFTPIVVKQEVYAPPTARFTSPGKVYGYCRDEAEIPSEDENENIPIILTGVPPFSVEISVHHSGHPGKGEVIRIKDILSNTYSWSLSRSSLGLGEHKVSIRNVKDSRGCESVTDNNPSQVRVKVSSPPKILPLETRTDYCVGDHVAFSLSGQAPFDIFYNFQKKDRKAHEKSHEFRRISDHPGEFIVTGIQDSLAVGSGGKCRAKQEIRKMIHPYPTVRISHGKTLTTDIHEGNDVEIVFEFTGTPPFDFTYTRSENSKNLKGRAPKVLETKHDSSQDFIKVVRASEEGTYEVVSIKDMYCSYAAPGLAKAEGRQGQKRLL